eukprot:jgi/Botrbrau1/3278/Bobra.174_1s0044.1
MNGSGNMSVSYRALSVTCWIICALAASSPLTNGAKVLGVALPYAKSHYYMINKIGEDLVSRGHNVTILVADIDRDTGEAALGAGISSIVYKTPWGNPTQLQDLKDTIQYAAEVSVLQGIRIRLGTAAEACSTLLGDVSALAAIEELHADLLLADSIFACSSLLADKFGLARVDVSPTGLRYPYHADIWRQQNPLLVIPQYGSQLRLQMGPKDVIWNLGVLLWARHVVYRPHYRALDRLRASHGIVPRSTLRSYRAATPLAIINDDFAFLPVRPLTPNIKVVGPIQPRPPQPLPADLFDFFEGAEDQGVVYVSLGTYDGLGHGELLTAMAGALSALPCRVLWKLGPSEFKSMQSYLGKAPELGLNIRTISFAPQNDVLGHRATRVFLSHLGLNSLYEAAYHGVPIVGLPLASDQPDNMKVAEHHGFGLEVPRRGRALPTQESIHATLLQVLHQSSYREAARRMSALLHGHRRAPLQVAADWVEHTLDTDGDTYLSMPYSRCRLSNVIDYFIPELATALMLALAYALVGFHFKLCFTVLRLVIAVLPSRVHCAAWKLRSHCMRWPWWSPRTCLCRVYCKGKSTYVPCTRCNSRNERFVSLVDGSGVGQAVCRSSTALLSSRPR